MAKTPCEKRECCTTCDANVGDDIVEIVHITRLISPEKGGRKVFESSVQTKMVKPGKSIVKREHKCYFIPACDDPYAVEEPGCEKICGQEEPKCPKQNDRLQMCEKMCECQDSCRKRYYDEDSDDSDGC